MKKTGILFLMLTFYSYAFSGEHVLLFKEAQKGYAAILSAEGKKIFVTENGMWVIERNKMEQMLHFNFTCNDAVVYKNNIVLAGNNGLKIIDVKNNTVTDLFKEKITGNINAVAKDQQGRLWFTKAYTGCFLILDSNTIIEKLRVPVTYCIKNTNDSNMWVGTNVGLYKIPVSGDAIKRFAEEGIASYDIPDNLVENIYTDSKSNIWAVMPENISFISPGDLNSEFPGYGYPLNNENNLYCITEMPGMQQGYLFATGKGIIFINGLKAGDIMRVGEIHQEIKETAFLLDDKTIETPAVLKNETITHIAPIGNEIYFITVKGMWHIKASRLANNLTKRFVKNTGR